MSINNNNKITELRQRRYEIFLEWRKGFRNSDICSTRMEILEVDMKALSKEIEELEQS